MTYFKYLCFIVLLATLSACQRELKVPLPEHQVRLVANAMLVADEPVSILVSRSFGMDEPFTGENIYLTDATVTLSRDGQAPEILPYRRLDLREFGYYSDQPAVPGSHYVLRVTHPDYPELRQEMVLPSRPRVTAIRGMTGIRFSQNGFRVDQIAYDLVDPADTANFYALEVSFRPDSITDPNTIFSLTRFWEPAASYDQERLAYGYSAVSDEAFDGRAVSLHFESDLFDRTRSQFTSTEDDLRQGYFVLRLHSLNEPAYRFGAELLEHRYSRNFSLPTGSALNQLPLPMYTNAEGGYGVFMGQTVRVDTLRW